MRISTAQLFQQGTNALLDHLERLSKTQWQLSTGKRIITPADDPAAAAQITGLNHALDSTQQFQANADMATSRLALEDTVLTGVNNALQRVRELAIQAHSGALTDQDRVAIAQEVQQRLRELLGLANSQDGNGEFLFAGYRGQTQPFVQTGSAAVVYHGDQGQRFLQISPTRQVAVSDPGDTVFQAISVAPSRDRDIFSILTELLDVLGTQAHTPPSSAPLAQGLSRSLTDLDRALENIRHVRAAVGARLNAIQDQKDVNEASVLQFQKTLSEVQDLDYAEAISRLNRELLGLQATQESFVRIQGLSLFATLG